MTPTKLVFRTPGRECAHADSGCCPKCFDPMGLLRSTREFRKKRHPRSSAAPTIHPKQEQAST